MKRLIATMIAMTALFGMASPASAAKPQEVTGTEVFQLTPTCDPAATCKTADGNVFITVLNPAVKTGTFTGTQVFDGLITVFKNGDFHFTGTVTFSGTVDGCGEGTVVFRGEGYGNMATGLQRSYQHTIPGKGTLKVQANLNLITIGPDTSAVTGTYHCLGG